MGGGEVAKRLEMFRERNLIDMNNTNNLFFVVVVYLLGPILPERLDVREIPVSKMRDLTINLSGKHDCLLNLRHQRLQLENRWT